MKRTFRSFVFASTCAALGVLPINNQPVFAQQLRATSEVAEEVNVVAPGIVQRKIVGRTVIGAPIGIISLSRPVSYADLDLTRQSDDNELAQRIAATAKAACKQLDDMYPESSLYQPIPSDQHCVQTATTDAMDEANLVIAATNQTAKK